MSKSKSQSDPFDKVYSDEEIAYWGRKLEAEICKVENAIEREKLFIEETKSREIPFFNSKKKEIKQAEDKLIELQNRLIELKSMMPLDYLIEEKGNDNQKSSMNIKEIVGNAGTVLETVGKLIPIKGGVVSGVGKLMKSYGNKKK